MISVVVLLLFSAAVRLARARRLPQHPRHDLVVSLHRGRRAPAVRGLPVLRDQRAGPPAPPQHQDHLLLRHRVQTLRSPAAAAAGRGLGAAARGEPQEQRDLQPRAGDGAVQPHGHLPPAQPLPPDHAVPGGRGQPRQPALPRASGPEEPAAGGGWAGARGVRAVRVRHAVTARLLGPGVHEAHRGGLVRRVLEQ